MRLILKAQDESSWRNRFVKFGQIYVVLWTAYKSTVDKIYVT